MNNPMKGAQSKKVMRRIAQIVRVLSKHGFGFLVDELKLRAHLPFFHRWQRYTVTAHNNLPKRMRMMMEELGGAYVKMGQILALRPDLVPQEYCNEFKRLHDRVPPFSYKQVKQIIEAQLNEPLGKIFSYVSKKPIGSASVAQVHQAKLHNGKKVVIKVQRPNIKEIFAADIDTMYFIAHRLEGKKDMYEFSPTKIVEEVERYTKHELDFMVEGDNIAQFYTLFRKSKAVKIPKYYRSLSTKKVLTMEYVEGIKLTDLRKVKKKFDRTKIPGSSACMM